MLPNVSTRLLPRRSGISSDLSSSTATKPGPSPRGLACCRQVEVSGIADENGVVAVGTSCEQFCLGGKEPDRVTRSRLPPLALVPDADVAFVHLDACTAQA